MKLGLGDIVSFLNEKGEGIITKIIGKTTVGVTIEDGFELPFQVKELILIKAAERPETDKEKQNKKEEDEKPNLNKLLVQKIGHSDKPKKSKPHAVNNGSLEMEINLHIEELMEDYERMSNSQIIQIQLRHFQNALDQAINNHCRTLNVIHGVGNGRLKYEVRKILSDNNIRFQDGSYAKYGFGATEILI